MPAIFAASTLPDSPFPCPSTTDERADYDDRLHLFLSIYFHVYFLLVGLAKSFITLSLYNSVVSGDRSTFGDNIFNIKTTLTEVSSKFCESQFCFGESDNVYKNFRF